MILREGVRNAVSHSEAKRVEVGIRVSSGAVVGYVEDDGRGFAEEDGLVGGWASVDEGACEPRGGTLELSSDLGVGTTIKASIPLKDSLTQGT